MTQLGEEYCFNFISMQSAFYRLPICYENNDILCNTGRNSIVKVHEKKLMHSWTLKQPHSFTCPVVFNESDETMCCVQDNNTILIWSNNDTVLDDASKIKLREPIFAIIPVVSGKPLVIFDDGKCMSLSDAISGASIPDGSVLTENEKLLWVDTFTQNDTVTILYIAFQQDKEHKLYMFSTNEENNTIENMTSRSIHHEAASLKSWCLNKHSDKPALLTAWSNGAIVSHFLDSDMSETLLVIPDIQRCLAISMHSIDSSHIAIARTDSIVQGCLLEIWDTKFCAVKGRKNLKLTSSDCLKVAAVKSAIFVSSSENLASIPINIEKSTLANAIGKTTFDTKQDANSIFSWTDDGAIENFAAPIVETDLLEKMTQSADEKVQKLINDLKKNTNFEWSNDLQNMSEYESVCLLQHALKYQDENMDRNDMPTQEEILNVVFRTSYSDAFLLKHLKKLSFKETLITLEILMSYLTEEDVASPERPSSLQVFSWTYLVIQSHTEELILSKDKTTLKLLAKLYKMVLSMMSKTDTMEKIDHMNHLLKLQQRTSLLPEKTEREKYCIEILSL